MGDNNTSLDSQRSVEQNTSALDIGAELFTNEFEDEPEENDNSGELQQEHTPIYTYHNHMMSNQTSLRTSFQILPSFSRSPILGASARSTSPGLEYLQSLRNSTEENSAQTLNPPFQRLLITNTGREINDETKEISRLLYEAYQMRKKYVFEPSVPWNSSHEACCEAPFSAFEEPIPPKSQHAIGQKDGVFYFFNSEEDKASWIPCVTVSTLGEYYKDLERLTRIITH